MVIKKLNQRAATFTGMRPVKPTKWELRIGRDLSLIFLVMGQLLLLKQMGFNYQKANEMRLAANTDSVMPSINAVAAL